MTKKRVIVCCIVAAVLVAFVGREIYLARFAEPDIRVNYMQAINDRLREASPRHSNRDFASFAALVKSIETADKQLLQSQPQSTPPATFDYSSLYMPAPAAETQLAQHALEAHIASGRLEDLRSLPEFVGTTRILPQQSMLSILFPELSGARQTARLLAARFTLAVRAADDSAAVEALEGIVALHLVLTHQATMIDRLTADAMLVLALDRIRDEHAGGRITGRLAQRLLAVLQRADQRPLTTLQLATERDFVRDIIQRTHSASGRFLPRAYAADIDANMASGIEAIRTPSLLMPSRETTERELLAYYDLVFAAAQQPLRVRNTSTMSDLAFKIHDRNPLLGRFLPALDQFVAKDDQFLTQLHGTQLLLGLEVFHAQTGSYPRALAQLVPSIFATLPVDPFAKDGVFVYRVRPADAVGGRPFLLYTVGADLVDNNGATHQTESTGLARNSAGVGFDFVFNKPARGTADAIPQR